MGNTQPPLRIIQEPQEIQGFRPWMPFEAKLPCCELVPHIRATQLEIRYQRQPALKNVSLEINRGCITALVGPSGCGKTSFLMSINRLTDLIVGCTVSGGLSIDNDDVYAPNTNVLQLRRKVGMIFQKPTVFPFSIKKNMELPLREHSLTDQTTIASTIEIALRQVGLWKEVKDRLDQPAQGLSGGQQQRLCLARALVLKPEILLLDEPCSALDPLSSGIVEDLIVSLRGRYTVIIVTHNLAQARRIADYVGFFWSFNGVGQLVENGPAQEIFEQPQHELTAAYISGARG